MEQHEIIETQKKIIDTISYGVKSAIIITDPKRLITHFNKTAEKMTGFYALDVINRPLEDVLLLENENGSLSIDTVCPMSDFDIEGVVFEGQRLKLTPQYETEEIVNVRSIKVKGGRNVNLGCIIFIESTFEQSELERMKLDFVSMSEHVLRTPITVIRGYISRLLEDKTKSKLDDVEINYINNALQGTAELTSLVENLLNIAEFRRGEVKVDMKPVNIEELVTKVVNEFKLVAGQKGLKLVFIPSVQKLPMVKADVSKIKIVLHNLVDNAIKYSKEGAINISLIEQEKQIEIAIKDSGRGIPEEFISQLFTKFYRVKKALEMEYGMGLGLYMSKKIVNAHGGDIWVESVEDKGSTFYFTLPKVETIINEDEISRPIF